MNPLAVLTAEDIAEPGDAAGDPISRDMPVRDVIRLMTDTGAQVLALQGGGRGHRQSLMTRLVTALPAAAPANTRPAALPESHDPPGDTAGRVVANYRPYLSPLTRNLARKGRGMNFLTATPADAHGGLECESRRRG